MQCDTVSFLFCLLRTCMYWGPSGTLCCINTSEMSWRWEHCDSVQQPPLYFQQTKCHLHKITPSGTFEGRLGLALMSRSPTAALSKRTVTGATAQQHARTVNHLQTPKHASEAAPVIAKCLINSSTLKTGVSVLARAHTHLFFYLCETKYCLDFALNVTITIKPLTIKPGPQSSADSFKSHLKVWGP